MKSAFALLAVAIVASGPAYAELKVQNTTSSYDVRGLSTKALHDEILKQAPREEGKVIDAETKDAVSWSLQFTTQNGVCRVATDTVHLAIDTMLPRWVDETAATEDVRKAWATYLLALRGHELQHRTISLKAAHAVDNVIHSGQSEKDCTDLEDKLKVAASKIMADAEAEHQRFDDIAPDFDIE